MSTASFDVNAFNEHVATIEKKLRENFKQNVYRSKFPVNKKTFVINETIGLESVRIVCENVQKLLMKGRFCSFHT